MTSSRGIARRVRNGSLALLVVVAVAGLAQPASSGGLPGSGGTDTSLPATDSAVAVSGRGVFADLRVSVNQTRNLSNQAISITWTGATPTRSQPGRFASDYLQIMQCWGDPVETIGGNPGPPPEQCVSGATDAVYGGRNSALFPSGYTLERIISRSGWPGFDAADGTLDERTGFLWKPFRAVDGTEVGIHYDPAFNPSIVGGSYWLNPYFNSITTNEIAGGRTRSNGTGAELFEVTTGLESSGLGCGQRVQPVAGGAPKEPQCWLVIVPRGEAGRENEGTPFSASSGVVTSPLSPLVWSNRIAIPLGFNPLDSACELSDEQRRIAGSEMPLPAVSSWQQALCTTPGLPPFAYGSVGDFSARQQLLSGVDGAPGMVAVSRPIAPSTVDPANPVVYAPISLSATVIGFNLERNPRPELNAEEELLRGVRVADLNLTPRLMAKLLTQSYRSQTAINSVAPYDWVTDNPAHLGLDQDFLRFNAEFELLEVASGKNFGGLVLPARGSDAAQQVWEWVLADPEAKAWLDGEPDEWGMRVNPIYATTVAANSTGAAFGTPVPDLYPKSDPYCFQAPPQGVGGLVVPPPLCGTDWLPYTQSLREAARLARIADDGARTSRDPIATSSDKVWRLDGPQILGSRTLLSLTDSASARQYGLQMARLSRAGDNGTSRRFIAPDDAGLTAGTQAMRAGAVPSVLEPAPLTVAPAAYPLTVLTYAAAAPLALDAGARRDYAAFVDYAAGPGQVSGLELGELPPGYTPLSPELRAQATTAARSIRDLRAPAAPVPPAPADTFFPSSAQGPSGGGVGSAGAPAAEPAAATPVTTPAVDEPTASLVATPILAIARNRWVLPALALIALVSGLGALEITRRPRRRPAGLGDPPAVSG